MLQHISSVKDGAIVRFPHSADSYMKVCNPHTGEGGVVGLSTGMYIPVSDLPKFDLGPMCHQDWDSMLTLVNSYSDKGNYGDDMGY